MKDTPSSPCDRPREWFESTDTCNVCGLPVKKHKSGIGTNLAIEPLGHDLNLDNPDDVDWLVRYTEAASKVVKERDEELGALSRLVLKVSAGKRPLLPMPELSQDAAFLAHVIQALEAEVKRLETELAGAKMDRMLK